MTIQTHFPLKTLQSTCQGSAGDTLSALSPRCLLRHSGPCAGHSETGGVVHLSLSRQVQTHARRRTY